MKRKIIVETILLFDIDDDVSDKIISKIVKSHPLHLDVVSAGEITPGIRSCYSLKSMKKHQKINIVPVKE